MEEKSRRYGSLVLFFFCMDFSMEVWILVWKYGFLWISLDFVWKLSIRFFLFDTC